MALLPAFRMAFINLPRTSALITSMATIFYGIAGEGRGHATRARAVVEALRAEHRLVLYAHGQAHDLLAPTYADAPEQIEVRRVPGLAWSYTNLDRPDYRKTLCSALPYLARLPRLVAQLRADIRRQAPALVITDFEPALSRAARAEGVPFVSLDHQHFLFTYDLRSLSPGLRRHAEFMGTVVRLYHRGAQETIVSAFFRPPLRRGVKRVTQIGPLLRPEVRDATTRAGSHLVAYIRRSASPALLDGLAGLGCEVRVYGLGAAPSAGRLRFFKIDPFRFVDDLASSRALVCTAGNQLIGEALYLGKPIFAMPERGNFEQAINAHFIAHSGMGLIGDIDHVTRFELYRFLDRAEELRERIDPESLHGNPAALARLRAYLPTKSHQVSAPVRSEAA
jgi:uncharacterized protein (TIGR00661 family)